MHIWRMIIQWKFSDDQRKLEAENVLLLFLCKIPKSEKGVEISKKVVYNEFKW